MVKRQEKEEGGKKQTRKDRSEGDKNNFPIVKEKPRNENALRRKWSPYKRLQSSKVGCRQSVHQI